ncbi:DUF262 domain-containing protein [Archangium lansingense]|uniref:DUF262 domain-containing protein n=1 Tax=Archangium lansingense TaxID=2995310 RepID=A0ABT4A4A6_9BACT|nr:DUF262 domain-containing protein [Archangium lansinium]MCY1076475.1 DUF262 domain-containing protein [Archangium lansinium]
MPSPSPLTRRPRATAFSIEDLLDHVRQGSIRIPKFQRPLKWTARDINELLDSVYRGYPIGTLLFWQREAPASHIEIGPVRLDAPQTAQALWVVDGQQRITALTGVLLHPDFNGEGGNDNYRLYFDLEKEDFVRPTRREQLPAHWLPMNVVVDSELLLNWLDRYSGRAEHPEHTRTAIKLGKMLREYQIPAYIVEADAEETLRIIFERLNSTGKALSKADVFHSLHGGLSREQPSDLRSLSRSLEEMEFGTIEEEWLLKAVLSIEGLDITRDFRSQFKGDHDLKSALRQTERALRDTIVFLKRDAGIPRIELLPYKLPLVILARFFHLHPEPSARSRELLSRWLWRGAITTFHRGESIPTVRKSLAAIGRTEDESIQALLSELPKAPARELNLLDYNFRTAETKLQVNALLALHPRDLRSGEFLDVPSIVGTQGATALRPIITSPPRLRPDDVGAPLLKRLMQGLANRLFHPAMEKHSLLTALEQPVHPEVLSSHGIPSEAFTVLQQGNKLGLLALRQRFLEHHIKAFLDLKARWLESDRKSLQSLLITDEEA